MVTPLAQGPQQIGTLTALDTAREWLLSQLAMPQAINCSLREAQGLVSAAPILAPQAMPAQDKALRDGWALNSSQIAGASAYSPVPLLTPPIAVRTGDDVPAGCDCVVDASSVEWAGPIAQAIAEAHPGEGLRRFGEDAKPDDLLIAEGQIIFSLERMVLEAAGVVQLRIRQPRLLLANAGADDRTTQMLSHLIKERGGQSIICDLDDDMGALIARHEPALVVIIGGSGSGQGDRSVQLLRKAGTLFCHGLALEPGRTAALGQLHECPVIVVPGLPAQALGLWFALLAPVHDHLTGLRAPRATAILATKIASQVGLAEVALLEQQGAQFVPLAIGDMSLRHLARATHLSLIGAQSEGFGAGEKIEALVLRRGI